MADLGPDGSGVVRLPGYGARRQHRRQRQRQQRQLSSSCATHYLASKGLLRGGIWGLWQNVRAGRYGGGTNSQTCFHVGARNSWGVLDDMDIMPGGELRGHDGCVNTIQFDETGNYLASGSDDTQICLWDVSELTHGPRRVPRLLRKVQTDHVDNIFGASFVPGSNGSRVVTTAGDGMITLIDMAASSVVAPGAGAGAGAGIYGADSGGTASAAAAATIRREKFSFEESGDRRHGHFTLTAEFVPGDANTVLVTTGSGRVFRCDLRTKRATPLLNLPRQRRAYPCTALAFDPFAPNTFAVGCNSYALLFDLRRQQSAHHTRSGKIFSCEEALQAWQPEGVFSNSDRTYRDVDGISSIAFCPLTPGRMLLNYRGAPLYIVDRNNYTPVQTTEPLLSPARNGVACLSYQRELCGRRNRQTFAKQACFFSGGRYVATGCDSGNAFVWDLWQQEDEVEEEEEEGEEEKGEGEEDKVRERGQRRGRRGTGQGHSGAAAAAFPTTTGMAIMENNGEGKGCGEPEGPEAQLGLGQSRALEPSVRLKSDFRATNCCIPHPHLPVLATSGIDRTIKLWGPCPRDGPLLELPSLHDPMGLWPSIYSNISSDQYSTSEDEFGSSLLDSSSSSSSSSSLSSSAAEEELETGEV